MESILFRYFESMTRDIVVNNAQFAHVKVYELFLINLPSEEFELTANSLGAHMKVIESSLGLGHSELILRTVI